MPQVILVVHVGVGLALKTDVHIGIAPHWQADAPFHQIPQIETHEQHLHHLARVDALMTDEVGRKQGAGTAKQHTHNVDSIKVLGWQYAVANNLHCGVKIAQS